MEKICCEDIYNLGLLYAYMDSNGMQKMVLLDDLNKFYKIVKKNLEEMNSDICDISASTWYDENESIYFVSSNKEGDVYCILKPGFDLDREIIKYGTCLSVDILKASLMENALECIETIHELETSYNENDNKKEKSLYLGSEVNSEK